MTNQKGLMPTVHTFGILMSIPTKTRFVPTINSGIPETLFIIMRFITPVEVTFAKEPKLFLLMEQYDYIACQLTCKTQAYVKTKFPAKISAITANCIIPMAMAIANTKTKTPIMVRQKCIGLSLPV